MGGIRASLPSFLTPPRSKAQQAFEENAKAAAYTSDTDSENEAPNTRTGRYRAQVRSMSGSKRSSNGPSSANFAMPHDRKRPQSSTIQADRPASPPPGYARPHANTTRRQTWGQPGAQAPEQTEQYQTPQDITGRTQGNAPVLSLDEYKSALKEWKAAQSMFLTSYTAQYVPLLARRFAHTKPELEAALRPFCGSAELSICMRHWDVETARFPALGMACANQMKAAVRDAWNEMVMLDEQVAGNDANRLAQVLRARIEEAYQFYLKQIEGGKENLWHTLDFNVDGEGLRTEVRETYWGAGEKLKVVLKEDRCGLPVLAVPSMEEGRRG